MGSLGSVGPLVMLDILLPTQQGNPYWFGDVQMFANAPSVGIYNQYLGQVELTGLPLATWQTLPFQLTSDLVTRLSGSYSDLTLTIAINVPANETGHYLLDNLRFVQAVTPILEGIAQDSNGVTKAVFSYSVGGSATVTVPYGRANFYSDANGFVAAPAEPPPTQFVGANPTPFVAALSGGQLTWTIGATSVTATSSLTPLPTETLPDGARYADLPGGGKVKLDTSFGGAALDTAIVPSDTSYTSTDQGRDHGLGMNNQPEVGPTSAGTLPGVFTVTDDGAASYVVPLALPPGRNGVEPHLSLVYNSRAKEGILGPGWSLSGVDRISRCKRTYAIANEQGGDPAPLYSNADELCMTDGQRLVPIGSDEYRLKRDIFTRFVVTARDTSGPLTIQAFRKDGLIETYGLDDNSRTQRVQNTQGPNGDITKLTFQTIRTDWQVAKVADRFGNEMDFSYTRSAEGMLPSTITYTSNPVTGRRATKTVTFNYQTKTGVPLVTRYQRGVFSAHSSILTSITVTAPNPRLISLVTTYKLTYGTPSITGRSLLLRLQRCDGAGVCMAPTFFDWDLGAIGFDHKTSSIDDFHPGTQDYVGAFTNGNHDNVSWTVEGLSRQLLAADFDGDGRDDLMYRTPVPTSTTIYNQADNLSNTILYYRLSTGTDFGSQHPATTPLWLSADPGGTDILGEPDPEIIHANNLYTFPMAANFNGRGYPDLIIPYLQPITDIPDMTRMDIFGAISPATWLLLPAGIRWDQVGDTSLNTEALYEDEGDFVLGDLNGDGLIDFGRRLNLQYQDGVFNMSLVGELGIRINQGGVLSAYQRVPSGAQWAQHCTFFGGCQNAYKLFVADLDGDGRSEVVMKGLDGSTYGVHAGVGGLEKVPANVPPGIFVSLLLDFNGDGLVDFINDNDPFGNHSFDLWVNTGNGFVIQKTGLDSALLHGKAVDVNGDGMDDIFVASCGNHPGGPSPTVYLSDGLGGFLPQTLADVPSGLYLPRTPDAVETTCWYTTLMDVNGDGRKDIVQPEPGSDHLEMYIQRPFHVDKLTGVVNGIGAGTSIEYSAYDGAAGDPCQYPYACSHRNIEVVTGYTLENGAVPAGSVATTHYSMHYQGVRVDAMGNGLLGFDLVQRTNDLTKLVTKRTFDLETKIGNWYPLVGLPTQETIESRLSGSGRVLTRARTTHYTPAQTTSDSLGPYFVAPDLIEEREIEQGGTAAMPFQRGTTQSFTYDEFGNVLTHGTLGEIAQTIDLTTYTVTNDADAWLLGQVSTVTVRSSTAASEVQEQVTNYDVDTGTGAVRSKTVQPGDPTLQLTTTFDRNGDGLVWRITEAPMSDPPRVTKITYDPIEGSWASVVTNPLGQPTHSVYHCGLGVLVSSTDPNGVATTQKYDGFGRLRNRTEGTGLSTDRHYSRPDNSQGALVESTESTGRAASMTYDVLGKEILRSETAFDGAHMKSVSRSYDPISGRQATVSRAYGAAGGTTPAVWTFGYDEVGRMLSIQAPGESLTTTVYEGLLATDYVDGVRKRTRLDDGAGRIASTVSVEPTSSAPRGEIRTSFDYGPFGNLRHVYQPGGSTQTMSYDPLGHRTEIDDPDGGPRIIHYNAFGEVVRKELPGQSDVVYTPDGLGRVTSLQQGDQTTTFQWDTASNGIGKIDAEYSPSSVTKSYLYQANGLVQSTTWTVSGTPFTFGWGYDNTGRLDQITYPDIGAGGPFAVDIGYGGDGHVAAVLPAAGGDAYWSKRSVNDDGQPLMEMFSDGLSGLHVPDPTTGRPRHIELGVGPTSPNLDGSGPTLASKIQSLSYVYYPDGKLKLRDDDVLRTDEEFFYDNVDRVHTWFINSSASSVIYGYDDSGNLKSRQTTDPAGATTQETYIYGENGAGPHALTTGPLGSYGYDPSGRQTLRPGQPTLTYTDFDLPRQVTQTGGTSVTFQYDAGGRRIAKTTADGVTLSLSFYERRVAANGATTHVFYLPGDGFAPVGQITYDASGWHAPAFFHQDRLGTLDTVTSSGVVTGRQKRDPFGRAYKPTNSSDPDPVVTLGFIGQSDDDELGVVNLNHRLYDATIGRFVTPDPQVHDVHDGQSYNRYAFALNNPLTFVDPTGLDPQENLNDSIVDTLMEGAEATDNAQIQVDDGSLILYGFNPDNGKKYSITLGGRKLDSGGGSVWGISTYSNVFGMGPMLPAVPPYPTAQSTSQVFASHAPVTETQPPSTAAAVGMGFVNLVPGYSLAEEGRMAWRDNQILWSVSYYGASLVESAMAVPALIEKSVVSAAEKLVSAASEETVPQVVKNALQGRAFEEESIGKLVQTDVQEQVSVRPYTASGELADFRVRLDALGRDEAGNLRATDFKSSEKAGFTPRQTEGYPLLKDYGGQVVGNNGGLFYPAGFDIPPVRVDIVRPGDL
jgi:RHS repeat-associated protein